MDIFEVIMANQGAIPKTPRKSSINIRGEQNDFYCILCNKEEPLSKHRHKLFADALTKTEACTRIEKVLELNIETIFQSGIVCRLCYGKVS